ncbi:MAG: response regulator, partial [Prolixibacteraceae bacterium]|nr:response regulator [Prolixibacteraceae bacterium]
MAKIRIEIQITLLALIIAGAVIGSGYLVYKSLTEIVDSVHQAALPDNRLLVMKDVEAELTKVENHVRLSIVTNEAGSTDKQYLLLRNSVYSTLRKLNSLNPLGIEDRQIADSVITIAHLKLENWNDVLILYESTRGAKPAFNELYSKLEKQKIDTVKTERPKRGFFRSIFGTSKTEVDTQLVVRDIATNEIREELERLESEWTQRGQQFNVLESKYIERNLELDVILKDLIYRFENHISERLIAKTNEADRLAAETNKRLAAFSVTAVVLLLIVLFLLYNYVRKSRRYERGLKAAKAEAESFAKAKEQFAANVSHEIRTPINAIYGLSEQILQKELNKNIREQMIVLAKSAFHLKNIVNDTLDFSKIQANKLKLETIHFSPAEVFNEIVAILRSDARAKGLDLLFQTKNELPEALIGDPLRLKQILLNLINNSLKFTENGHIILNVETIKNSEEKFLLKMMVEDTGIGISEKDQEIIFDEFVQAENSAQKKYKGTGLGLSIVKKLIDLQQGKISVESTLGAGTKIFIEIPYEKGDVSEIEDHFSPVLEIPESFRQIFVLVADDEEFNRFLLKGIFEKWGVSYAETDNGNDAVDLAFEGNFNLILMDLNMPGKNGIEATKEILAKIPEIKIVGITASTDKADLDSCVEAGMKGVLIKPFSEVSLLQKIKEILDEKVKVEAVVEVEGKN